MCPKSRVPRLVFRVMKESPKTKAWPPAGWEIYVKRGVWCVRDPRGFLHKFATEKEAKVLINGE